MKINSYANDPLALERERQSLKKPGLYEKKKAMNAHFDLFNFVIDLGLFIATAFFIIAEAWWLAVPAFLVGCFRLWRDVLRPLVKQLKKKRHARIKL